ncbi:hypothetical protein ACFPTY_19845 [Halomonas beimenensis]
MVNDKAVNIPSYQVKRGDVVSVREKARISCVSKAHWIWLPAVHGKLGRG